MNRSLEYRGAGQGAGVPQGVVAPGPREGVVHRPRGGRVGEPRGGGGYGGEGGGARAAVLAVVRADHQGQVGPAGGPGPRPASRGQRTR